ncbi:hypothetical protein [Brevibacillus reuszeri]|uniref:hypothetical protein n=1 Tax=Brevibacillus reuszeri TaxID=54915 RepID=UPI003D1FAF93
MTRSKENAKFIHGKSAPLLPGSDAEWVTPFNTLLDQLNEEPTDHPLLKGLGARPSRNNLVQHLIMIGLDTVNQYKNRVFIETNQLSEDLIDLLNTPAGQKVIGNLLAMMDGKTQTALNFTQENTTVKSSSDIPVHPKINSENDVVQSSLVSTDHSSHVQNSDDKKIQIEEYVVPLEPIRSEKDKGLSPLERARMLSNRSNL